MSGLYRIRLVGGPYDGDHDRLNGLPTHLWVYPCRCSPSCAAITPGGQHLEEDDRTGAVQDGSEEYRYSYDELGIHFYLWRHLAGVTQAQEVARA